MICRYGHQDFYRVLGRDPVARPMSAIERAIFAACLAEFWEKEVKERPTEALPQ
jgi:hypothetical protein